MGRWKKWVMARGNWYRDKIVHIEGLGGSKMNNRSRKLFQQAGRIKTSTVMFLLSTRRDQLNKLMKEKEQVSQYHSPRSYMNQNVFYTTPTSIIGPICLGKETDELPQCHLTTVGWGKTYTENQAHL